jgi:arsenical pump membrane protein
MIAHTWQNLAIFLIGMLSIAGVIGRPKKWPEAIWAVAGASLLVLLGLLPVKAALSAVGKGSDVYFFLTGMMLLAELAREQGLFDYVAARTVNSARGSASRLFILVYGVGTLTTIFLSNDATAVVLTPAVLAAARAAKAEPLPYLFICAFIANAASFVLPISNPANLVVFGDHMPGLLAWLRQFALPSVASILITFLVLRWTQSRMLGQEELEEAEIPEFSGGARATAMGIGATAAVLMTASALGLTLGWPTALAAALTLLAVSWRQGELQTRVLGGVSWSVLPLVAGLFVLTEALSQTGLVKLLEHQLTHTVQYSPRAAPWLVAGILAVVCNLVNNLPAGLMAGTLVAGSHVPATVTGAVLLGVDLGPNLSVTGSLATILWLVAIRREGEHVSGWQFLKLGLLVMPSALVLSLAALLLVR